MTAELNLPPQALEAERNVLSCLLQQDALMFTAKGWLQPDDFHNPLHRKVYQAMDILSTNKITIELHTVWEWLKQNMTEDCPVFEEIATISEYVPTTQIFTSTARLVKETSTLRKLWNYGHKLVESTPHTEAFKAGKLLADMQNLAFDLLSELENQQRKHVIPPKEGAEMIAKDAETKIQLNQSGKSTMDGPPTGFAELDEEINGLQDVNVVSAYTGVGKSALCLNWAINIAINQTIKTPVLYLNYEMAELPILRRIGAILSGVPIKDISKGTIGKNGALGELREGLKKYSDGQLWITDNNTKNIYTSLGLIRKFKSTHDIQVVFVDYLGEIAGDSYIAKGGDDSEYQVYGRYMDLLKETCASLKVKLVVACQQSRKGDIDPSLTNTQGSIKIPQKADVFMILKDLNNGKPGTAPDYQLILDKNRNGSPKTSIPLVFNKEVQQIYEITIKPF